MKNEKMLRLSWFFIKAGAFVLFSLLIAAGTIVVLLTLKKVKEPYIILIAAIIGWIIRKY